MSNWASSSVGLSMISFCDERPCFGDLPGIQLRRHAVRRHMVPVPRHMGRSHGCCGGSLTPSSRSTATRLQTVLPGGARTRPAHRTEGSHKEAEMVANAPAVLPANVSASCCCGEPCRGRTPWARRHRMPSHSVPLASGPPSRRPATFRTHLRKRRLRNQHRIAGVTSPGSLEMWIGPPTDAPGTFPPTRFLRRARARAGLYGDRGKNSHSYRPEKRRRKRSVSPGLSTSPWHSARVFIQAELDDPEALRTPARQEAYLLNFKCRVRGRAVDARILFRLSVPMPEATALLGE